MRVPHLALFTAIVIILTVGPPSPLAQYVYNQAAFPVATGPGVDVVTADFHGDGILDLAVVMDGNFARLR